MRLKGKLGYARSDDIKTKDLRNIFVELVKDETKDDLALQVFYLIVFMKVVIPGTSTRVSREAAMAENLVFEDMADMDYCQLVMIFGVLLLGISKVLAEEKLSQAVPSRRFLCIWTALSLARRLILT